MKKIHAINDWIAIKMTLAMSNMWCVWLFLLMALIPLAVPSLTTVIQYVSGAVIQLAALPLIMVGQNLLNRGSEKRAIQDHKALIQALTFIHELVSEVHHVAEDNHTESRKLQEIKMLLSKLVETPKKLDK